jgi:hypothetical protein
VTCTGAGLRANASSLLPEIFYLNTTFFLRAGLAF